MELEKKKDFVERHIEFPQLEGMIKYLIVHGDGADQMCCLICDAKGEEELTPLKELRKHISPLFLDISKNKFEIPRFGNLTVNYLKKEEIIEVVSKHNISHLMEFIVRKKLHNMRRNLYIKLGFVCDGIYYERSGDDFNPKFGKKLTQVFKLEKIKIIKNPFEGRPVPQLEELKMESKKVMKDFKKFQERRKGCYTRL